MGRRGWPFPFGSNLGEPRPGFLHTDPSRSFPGLSYSRRPRREFLQWLSCQGSRKDFIGIGGPHDRGSEISI